MCNSKTVTVLYPSQQLKQKKSQKISPTRKKQAGFLSWLPQKCYHCSQKINQFTSERNLKLKCISYSNKTTASSSIVGSEKVTVAQSFTYFRKKQVTDLQ